MDVRKLSVSRPQASAGSRRMTPASSFLCVVLLLLLSAPTLAAEGNLTVTVYRDDLALVRQTRTVELTQAVSEVRVEGIPALIEPASVQVIPQAGTGDLKVLEQRFEHGLSDTGRLLRGYVGRNIQLTTREGGTFTGTLLQEAGGDVIVELADRSLKIVKSQALDSYLLPELPRGAAKKPALVWLLQSDKPGRRQIENLYLTRGVQWSASYVARLSPGEDSMELRGLASVDNRSGSSFEDAGLNLVAGEVHRGTPPPQPRQMDMGREVAMMSKAAPEFEERPVFEYHLYRLSRKATLGDQRTTTLLLFEPAVVKVQRGFSYDGERDQQKVRAEAVFQNRKTEGLGIPLPAGRVQVYEKSGDTLIFTGEDAIEHTPEGEEVKLSLGYAFDVVGERTVLETKQASKRSRQETVEIRLRNHKETPVKVSVIEHFGGSWEFVGKTPLIRKKEASKVEFELKVPKGGEEVFQYTVLYNW